MCCLFPHLEKIVNYNNLRLFACFKLDWYLLNNLGMVGMCTKFLVGMGFKKMKLSENKCKCVAPTILKNIFWSLIVDELKIMNLSKFEHWILEKSRGVLKTDDFV